MPVERAVTAYRRERLNCAQSVLRAFQPEKNVSDETIRDARAHGGGRAEAGLCGALYAALQLTEAPAARARMTETFVSKAGSCKCREIRLAARIPCVECVRLAAGLVANCGVAGAGPNPTAAAPGQETT